MKMKTLYLWLFLGVVFTAQAQHPNRDLPFSWENATTYFVLTDRFENGKTSNDNSYGRGKDGNGNDYNFDPIGSFYGGDFVGMTQRINDGYFDDLGVNAIWFTAPYEQIHGWVSGSNGEFQHYAYHGYYGLDWTEMDANYGTAEEFRAFVDAAHEHGIRVVMDIVMNHVGYNTLHDMAEFNFGCVDNSWRGWRPNNGQTWSSIHDLFIDYNCSNWNQWWSGGWIRAGLQGYPQPGGDEKTQTLAGLPDVITESPQEVGLPPVLLNKWSSSKLAQEQAELNSFFSRTGLPRTTRNHFIKWLTDWVREYGIDGFRVDTEKHVEGAAWLALKNEAKIALREWKSNNPSKALDDKEFWMVGENFGYGYGRSDYHINSGYDALINFAFQGQAGNLGNLENIYSDYANALSDDDWNVLSYVSSHDTELYDRGNLMNAGTSLLLLPGGVQIFYGDETGRPKGIEPSGDPQQSTRSYMNWDNINQGLLSHWQKLGQFRRNHLAIGAGSHQMISSNPYTFKREAGDDRVVVVIGTSGSTTINVSSIFPDGTELRDFYTEQVGTVSGGNITFNAHSNGVILIEETNPMQRPVLTVNPASSYDPNSIILSASVTDANDPNPTIYYTTNLSLGTSNLGAWNTYTGPLTFTETTEIQLVAQNQEGALSSVITRKYTIGDIDGFSVWFKKPDGWGNATIYYWLTEPENILPEVAWPGSVMTDEGDGWYRFDFTGILSSNIIFNENGGAQTDDLERDRNGWYIDGAWLDTDPRVVTNQPPSLTVTPNGGTFTVGEVVTITMSATDDRDSNPNIYYTLGNSTTPTLYTGSFTIDATTTLTAYAEDSEGLQSPTATYEYTFNQAGTGLTIHFKGNGYTNPHIHYWNTTPAVPSTTWPGEAMEPEANGWYVYTIEDADCANIVFNNNGGAQTADLQRCQEGWYVDGVWYDSEPTPPAGLKIYFRKPSNWGSAYMHYWNTTPAGGSTNWPGVAMTDEGDGWYSYTIADTECANIVFNDNGGAQTGDLSVCGEGRYDNGWQTSVANRQSTAEKSLELLDEEAFVLYPNPSDGTNTKLDFSLAQDQKIQIAIYDTKGMRTVLYNEFTKAGKHQLSLPLQQLPKGMYILQLTQQSQTMKTKLIIK